MFRWENEEGLNSKGHRIGLIRINLRSVELLTIGREIWKETNGQLKSNKFKGFWSLNPTHIVYWSII